MTVKRAYSELMAHRSCILGCRRRPEIVGYFQANPEFNRLLFPLPGKRIVYLYWICEPCMKRPGAQSRVEAAFLRDGERRKAMAVFN
jgi:hypothetical protein